MSACDAAVAKGSEASTGLDCNVSSFEWRRLVTALADQWTLLTGWAATLDVGRASAVDGWRNSDVLTHLAQQAEVLASVSAVAVKAQASGANLQDDRSLRTLSAAQSVLESQYLQEQIDASVRRAPAATSSTFAASAAKAISQLRSAEPNALIPTSQGLLRLHSYVRTRCLEAVAHARDLRPALPRSDARAGDISQALAAQCFALPRWTEALPRVPRRPRHKDFEVLPVSPTAEKVIDLIQRSTDELAISGYAPEETFGYTPEELVARGVFLLGARHRGILAGICGLETQPSSFAELKRLFVVPELRGTGAADVLVDWLLGFAMDAGITTVRLETGDKRRAARGLYRRHGFTVVPAFPPYGDSKSSVCMAKDVSSFPY